MLLSLACLLPCALAAAEPPRPSSGWLASYEAAPGCPPQADFERRVSARLSGRELRPARLALRLVRTQGGVRASLSALGDDASRRELSAASCEEAADALALVAALLLQAPEPPNDVPAAPPAALAPAPRTTPPTREPAAQTRAVEQEAIEQPEAARIQPAAETPIAPPTATSLPPPTPLPPPRAPFFSAPELSLSLAGLVLTAVAPDPRPGLSLGAALSGLARRGPRLAVSLALRASLPHEERSEAGEARFAWWSSATGLCAEGPERRLRAAACGLLELGALHARGSASESGHTRARFWGAAGARLSAALALPARLRLRLSGELLGVLVRDRFFLADQLLFSVPKLAFRGELALELGIW